MGTTRYDRSRNTDWVLRSVVPASAWALLFAFFAAAGWASLHEPALTVYAGPSAAMIADTAAQLTGSAIALGTPGTDAPDPAVTELEVLDPVGAGHTP